MTRSIDVRPIPPRRRLPWLIAGFLPWYAWHLAVAPYRGRQRAPLGERHRSALYDGVLNLMLNGYASLSGRPLPPGAGRMAVLFTRIAFAFDDEYERRRSAGETVDFDAVFGAAGVQLRVAAWREYMAGHPAYPRIRDFLETFVRELFREYVTERPDLMRAAELDSGGFLVAVVTIVALAQESALSDVAADAFVGLGVLGKLIDDLIDLRLDRRHERANLVDAMVDEDERAEVERGLAGGVRMDTQWWQSTCPVTSARYRNACAVQYGRLRSRWLRFAAHMLWVPALLGRSTTVDRRGRT